MKYDSRFRIGVFVRRRKRSWGFTAYSRDFQDCWSGCNLVEVDARTGTEAKQKAIAVVKARMNLNSQISPTCVQIVGE